MLRDSGGTIHNFDFIYYVSFKMSLVEILRKNSQDVEKNLTDLQSKIIAQNRAIVVKAVREQLSTSVPNMITESKKPTGDTTTWTYEMEFLIPYSGIQTRFNIDVRSNIISNIKNFFAEEGFTVITSYRLSEDKINKTYNNNRIIISWRK